MTRLEDIFGDGKKPLPRVEGVLTYLWRKVITDIGVNKSKWAHLIHRHIVREGTKIENTPTARSSAKRNKTKALGGSNITWKTFTEGVRILAPRQSFLRIKLTRDDGEYFEDDVPLSGNSALGKFFKELAYTMEITIDDWDANMKKYINSPKTNLPNNPKKRSTHRGNLDKALSNSNLTWATLQRGLIAHRIVKFEYELHITWASRKTTIHKLCIENH